MLAKWGTDQADALGVPCIVEASAHAYEVQFYHKHGFMDMKRVCYVDEDKYPGKLPISNDIMYRPGKGEKWAQPKYKEVVVSKPLQVY